MKLRVVLTASAALSGAAFFLAATTTNTSAVLTTNVQGASYRFATPAGPAARFYRIQSP